MFQVYNCTWSECINPKAVENMVHDHEREPYAFGQSAKYRCKDNYYPEKQRDAGPVEVECLTDGSFAYPDSWPTCVKSER